MGRKSVLSLACTLPTFLSARAVCHVELGTTGETTVLLGTVGPAFIFLAPAPKPLSRSSVARGATDVSGAIGGP